MKIGVVADIHFGPDKGTKLGSRAPQLLQKFFAACEEENVDFVVDLGDRINNPGFRTTEASAEEDARMMREAGELFAACPRPRWHITGNHDALHLERSQIAELMDAPVGSRYLRIGNADLILWDATVHPSDGTVALSQEDLQWLKRALRMVQGPAVVCAHIPFDDGSMAGNPYFSGRWRPYATYANGAEARALIEQSGKVVLCLAGHTHWFQMNVIGGIAYVTVPSLTESATTGGEPEGAYAIVDVGERVSVRIGGVRDLRIDWRTPGPVN